ncbi:MAG: choice-of-anchor J domain-containing protein [Candidatus Cloacimonetes bacterium]|nr:choice-of-anchor J domain-containing protein [Candidatus Cloacimonadota bacterium]
MQTKLNTLFLMLIFTVFAISSWALVSEYTFTSTVGTYTEITDGTVLPNPEPGVTNPTYNAIALGFDFVYDNVTYTSISVAENGFLAMGNEVITQNLPISASAGTNNLVAALSRDIIAQTDGQIMYLLSGTAPERVFTVQWKNFRRVPTAASGDIINFQIQLHEGTNEVIFCYGNVTVSLISTAQTVQVGMRGADNTDFNNRTTTSDWTATEAGTANNNSCRINNTVYPPLGLTFTFTPVQQGNPPMPAQNPQPAHQASAVNPGTALSWITGGGAPTGYKVYLGTNNPPTNIANGTVVTATTYIPAAPLSYNTDYYWQIVPFNADGDATGCPVWSFTTWADPTITVYPYTQNFDDVTPPALPMGWTTVNANGDAYSWESNADASANTAPNAMRIRYNTDLAMDDWLITPPMQVTADYFYRVQFYYRSNSASYPEKLALYMGSSPNVAAMTEQVWINANITNPAYQMAEILVPITTSETVYFGFHGHSEEDQFYLYVDSFSINEVTEVLNPPTDLAATVNGNDVHLSWTAPGDTPPPPDGFNDGFEDYQDFAITFDPWVLVDVDQSATYGMQDYSWANAYAAQAFMIFNPSATTPAITDLSAHSGAKMAACFASTTPPNNDWMITPLINIEAGAFFNFWAKSYTAQYGLERFKVGVSTGGTAPADFTIISGTSYVSAPVDWTLYSYDLAAYAGQDIRIGIQCVSSDAFIFLVDDVSVGAIPVRMDAPVASTGSHTTIARTTGTPVPANPTYTQTRDLLGYKVYRDGNLIQTINSAATVVYDDMDLEIGNYTYTVTANYDSGESEPAGPVAVTIANILSPLDLAATVEGNDVTLNWSNPVPPLTGEWITWCNVETLGNSIGTNSAAEFDVAHMFDATDLAEYQGGSIAQIKFVPAHQACVYTVKVWTGGTAAAPGTLVYSAEHSNFVLNEWNLHILSTPIPVPSDRLWIGYGVNTQGGYPAGCDEGPQIEGKGNMMNFDGWTTLSQLNADLVFNWSIQGFVADGATMKAITPKTIVETPKSTPTGTLAVNRFEPSRNRALTGYKVYRDGAEIANISNPEVTTYQDLDLPNGQYVYGVSAVYHEGESEPATVGVTVDLQLAPVLFEDSFEDYDDFTILFAPWTLLDQDLQATYGFENIQFPNSGSPMAYIIFNPASTVPPITDMPAYEGNKMAASFAATTPPNNDWLITPRITLGTNSALKFYAKSHTANYGLERFRVGISTMASIIPQGFQYLTGPDYVEAPINWTEYMYDLSAYDGQSVFITIRCVSNDAFVFYVDNFAVHTNGGSVSNDEPTAPIAITELKGNYPNPFNPETTIRFSVKEAGPVSIDIYNLKGQLVKTLLSDNKAAGEHSVIWKGTDNNNQPVSSGVYFYKMNAGKYSSTRKMIMMK